MASSLKELIEEWEWLANSADAGLSNDEQRIEEKTFNRCIEGLKDTLLVMEAEEVRKNGN